MATVSGLVRMPPRRTAIAAGIHVDIVDISGLDSPRDRSAPFNDAPLATHVARSRSPTRASEASAGRVEARDLVHPAVLVVVVAEHERGLLAGLHCFELDGLGLLGQRRVDVARVPEFDLERGAVRLGEERHLPAARREAGRALRVVAAVGVDLERGGEREERLARLESLDIGGRVARLGLDRLIHGAGGVGHEPHRAPGREPDERDDGDGTGDDADDRARRETGRGCAAAGTGATDVAAPGTDAAAAEPVRAGDLVQQRRPRRASVVAHASACARPGPSGYRDGCRVHDPRRRRSR